MPARSPTSNQREPVVEGKTPGRARQFGPVAYTDWRRSDLGTITEQLERRLILRLVGPLDGRRMLDVGCGDGALAMSFWESGAARVVGCDVDPRMIASAAADAWRHSAAVDYLLAEGERLPFRDRSFEVVTIITVLAFIPRPELMVREIVRVLKPGGRVIIGELGKWSLWAASRRLRGWLGRAPMWRRARFTSARRLCQLVEAGGLDAERVAGAIYFPRCVILARAMARLDPLLGELTTIGAAFVAIAARKAA